MLTTIAIAVGVVFLLGAIGFCLWAFTSAPSRPAPMQPARYIESAPVRRSARITQAFDEFGNDEADRQLEIRIGRFKAAKKIKEMQDALAHEDTPPEAPKA